MKRFSLSACLIGFGWSLLLSIPAYIFQRGIYWTFRSQGLVMIWDVLSFSFINLIVGYKIAQRSSTTPYVNIVWYVVGLLGLNLFLVGILPDEIAREVTSQSTSVLAVISSYVALFIGATLGKRRT